MKWTLIVCLIVPLLSLCFVPHQAKASSSPDIAEGDGSLGNPYIVTSAYELDQIRYGLDRNYKLGADIDLGSFDAGDGKGWMPIGSSLNQFTGTFDGGGYVIRNLTINRSDLDNVGLFGVTEGTLTRAALLNAHVQGGASTGGLAGYADSIDRSYVMGDVSGTRDVGGLAGSTWSVNESYSTAAVSATYTAGGVVGFAGYEVNQSFATGDVTGRYVGGLIGEQDGAIGYNVINDYAAGKLTFNFRSRSGGLIGSSTGSLILGDGYWNQELNPSLSGATGTQSTQFSRGYGKTTSRMKSKDTYDSWDFTNTWGIREGETYPYLLAFSPMVVLSSPPSSIYNLTAGQDSLSFAGTLRDGSIGEPIVLSYEIRDDQGQSVTSVTYQVYATGDEQAIGRSFPLSGLRDGTYTLNVSAADTYNPPVSRSIPFTVDTAAPHIRFANNGSDAYVGTVSTAVYADDALSGIASLQYAWTPDPDTPASGWSSFASGDELRRTNASGDWYLHIRATDGAGNEGNIVSNAFHQAKTVIYDGIGSTGGAVPVDARAYAQNDTVTVCGNTGGLVRNGYHFTGWNTKADGSGTKYAAGGTFVMGSSDVTLYAQWTPYSAVADLSSLALSGIMLSPPMNGAIYDYQATIPYTVTETAVTYTTVDPNAAAELQLDGAPAVNPVRLQVGSNAIGVVVTAEDGTTQTYTITVVRSDRDSGDSGDGSDAPADQPVPAAPVPAAPDPVSPAAPDLVPPATSEATFLTDKVDHASLLSFLKDRVAQASTGSAHVPFPDISSHWSRESIELFAKLGVIDGYEDGSFHPDEAITRGEFAALLSKIFNLKSSNSGSAFADASSHWAKPFIDALAARGLINGYDDGTYRPDQTITRAEMIALIGRIVDFSGVNNKKDGHPFADIAGNWNEVQIREASGAGIVQGEGTSTFAPDEALTRAEALTVILRAMELNADIRSLFGQLK